MSFDPEGFAISPNGHFFVADEYGPSIYEFAPAEVAGKTEARFVRAFTTPDNLKPRDINGLLNYANDQRSGGNPTGIVRGRQESRSFEALTLTPDGSKLFAISQDPLMEEGSPATSNLPLGDGRRSRNVRLVEFDVASGASAAQYIYQLESLADINQRIPGAPYSAGDQGRKIGLSSAIALSESTLLITERDDRGRSGDDPTAALPVSTKRIYQVNLTGATNAAGVSLANTNTLVGKDAANQNVTLTPVTKTLYLNIAESLTAAGLTIPEKMEGITFGPTLADGRITLLIGADNDFSSARRDDGTQVDVYIDSAGHARYTPIDDPSHSFLSLESTADQGHLPEGYDLLPSAIYGFVVPEPAGALWLLAAIAGLGRRRGGQRALIRSTCQESLSGPG
jgi:hypothetical protein